MAIDPALHPGLDAYRRGDFVAARVEWERAGEGAADGAERVLALALARLAAGLAGDEIRQRICADCWAEWLHMEVMVINELRLNFMDPGAQQTLNQHMRQFLFPGEAEASEPAAP